MNYFDDELEKEKDGRDGRNQKSPGQSASRNPRPVRRPASRETSGNRTAPQMGNRNSQPQRTVRSQAAGDYSQPGPSSRRQPGSGSSGQPGQSSRRQPVQGGTPQPGRDGREPQRVSRARTSANSQSPRPSGGPKLNGNGQDFDPVIAGCFLT